MINLMKSGVVIVVYHKLLIKVKKMHISLHTCQLFPKIFFYAFNFDSYTCVVSLNLVLTHLLHPHRPQ